MTEPTEPIDPITTKQLWQTLQDLEVAAYTLMYAYKNCPDKFYLAFRNMDDSCEAARKLLLQTRAEVNPS